MNGSVNINPLVSFILCTYNQSEFVVEAINGALSQTYSPLEIIISDDCSSDNTFAIITDMVNQYQGVHTIIVNQNSINVGTSEHVNQIVQRATGELLVFSAGDDVSLSHRVSTIVERWVNSGSVAFFSNLNRMNSDSQLLGNIYTTPPVFAERISDILHGKPCWTIGASFACDKRVFNYFNKIPKAVLQEDGCLAFRALLLGNIEYVNQPLVNYRFHEGSVSQHFDAQKRLVLQKSEYYMHASNLQDAILLLGEEHDISKYLWRKIFFFRFRHHLLRLPFWGLIYNKIRIVLARKLKGV